MSETAPEPRPGGGGKKILGVPRTTFFIAMGGAVLVGLAFFWWRNYQAAQAGASAGSGGTSGNDTGNIDTSGQLSTIQAELETLLQEEGAPAAASTGSTGGGGGSWSGGGGSGGWSGGSGDSGSTGSGGGSGNGMNGAGSPPVSSSGGSSGTTTPVTGGAAKSSAPTGGNATRVSNNGATVNWQPNGATKWQVEITGPGPLNGRVNTVTVPQAVYSGLSAGHTYSVKVTPLSPPGPSGTVTFVTTK